MIVQRFKSEYFYIFIISFLTLLGAHFTASFSEITPYKISAHLLLFINACAIYSFAIRFSQQQKMSWLVTVLYLMAPSHADAFLFASQIQPLMAETCLILGLVSGFNKQNKLSFLFIAGAVFLNTKLIFFYPFYLLYREVNIWQKAFVFSQCFIAFIFLIPIIHASPNEFFFRPESIFYGFELLMIAIRRSILNYSLILPGYYSRFFLIGASGIFLILSGLLISKKNIALKFIGAFLLVSFLGTLVPMYDFFKSESLDFYINTTSYPLGLLALLLGLLIIEIKKEKMGLVLGSCFVVFWGISGINFQKHTLDIVDQWNRTMYSLPEDFNQEEAVKWKYTSVLIETGEYSKAEEIVNLARVKFKKDIWYTRAINLAARRQDQKAIDNIQYEAIINRIPMKFE